MTRLDARHRRGAQSRTFVFACEALRAFILNPRCVGYATDAWHRRLMEIQGLP